MLMDLFKSFQHKADPSKSGFDLSRKHVFSTKVGQLVPCLSLETVPGDHFEIDLASLTRTETFNTAAFLRGKQRFDFFFVPYTQLWHPFNQFISQRSDKHSTTQKGHIYAPVVNLSDLLGLIWHFWADDSLVDVHDVNVGPNAVRLLDMLGYGNFQWIFNFTSYDDLVPYIRTFEDRYVNVFRLAAYQHIWYDFFRNKFWDVDATGGLTASVRDADTASFGYYLEGFNFDDITCDSFASSVIQVPQSSSDTEWKRFCNLLCLRYAPWKKDLFTSSMPSQQFGAISTVDISGVNIFNDSTPLTNGVTASVTGTGSAVVNALYRQGDASTNQWSIPSAFDVLSLRKSEALQQWKQNTLRGGNMTDDAFESHFGVKPYYEGDENVHYLGSFSSVLQVNPVEATASTSESSNSRVGDLAATGTIVTNGSKLKFDCKDFGIIMCVASYVPESEYSSSGIEKANTLHEQFDWFTPEFQNIGLESIQVWNQSLARQASDSLDNIIGFAPRYWMYKTAVDKVFGEFADSVSPVSANDLNAYQTHQGSLQPWVSPRYDILPRQALNANNTRPLGSLYVSPSVYDNVSSVVADADQNTDFFIHNVFFDIKAIRPMTVLGLPQF